jgi:hypothetical protein
VRPSGAAPYRQAAHGAHSSLSLSGDAYGDLPKQVAAFLDRLGAGTPGQDHRAPLPILRVAPRFLLSGRDAQPGMDGRTERVMVLATRSMPCLTSTSKCCARNGAASWVLLVRAKAVGNLGIGLTPDVPLSPIAIVAETVAGTPKPAFRELRGHRMHQQWRIRGLIAGRRCGQTWRTVASLQACERGSRR